ncbi:hypothetical protein acdb102_15880 [Acidothermaceae bacterium B102]|nr:hypothetical protein acdb102_15880 [Acidothermaceae bacterium B102]
MVDKVRRRAPPRQQKDATLPAMQPSTPEPVFPSDDVSSHPLLAPLTPTQRELVDVVADVWLRNAGRWPIRAYVEHEMARRGSDLGAVLASFPTVPRAWTGVPTYGAVWYDRGSFDPRSPVGLTVAGMAHLPLEHQSSAEVFLGMLRLMNEYFLASPVDPFAVEPLDVELALLRQRLRRTATGWIAEMPDVFAHEPATWGGATSSNDGQPRWRYTGAMRYFAEVDTIPKYLHALTSYLEPPTSDPDSLPPQTLDFAASLDFLDTVWVLRFGKRLVRLPGAQSVASCSAEASTAEEFDARLSALVEVLKGFEPEGPGKHPVVRLRAQLLDQLPPEAHARIMSAVDLLQAVSPVRNGAQHHRVAAESVAALAKFGLAYPIEDWQEAWGTIRAWTSFAFAELRDEVLADARSRMS